MDLKGKRVVVLGGTSGIGYAVAEAAGRAGATPVVVSSRQANVEAAIARLPQGAEGQALDLRDEAAVAAFFAKAEAFDHLVFTAGETLQLGPLQETSLDTARAFFELRYWGAVTAVKHGAARIRGGGSIVLTSGIAGRRPQAGWTLGASICSAMEGLTRALAVELAPLRVNLVSPGFVRTPLWRDMPEAQREAMYQAAGEKLPVGRVGEATDLAEAYLFLMRQGFATGQTFVVDGGGVLV
ncbi:SDR family oxidoreductase [Lichenifustis flavocetrariae]|uniref:SDR family oxidoreductase n=1 Tax=Lichenifustis flavocetrariae TaxID=2949735 RepID=A0AA41Z0T8_9HYPH|nr:SDR family oxidoreductase [Lichenifustis flavocetrariae]MCW6510852.1 SDR family oxidoreductase [Lichenifustis flavocetrariae]